jgi:glycosyltransferase involved in cell wall biosynthesis
VKKVLIITYYWPPSGGAGVQRWLKFVKYLPEYDIQPWVVTVDPESAYYPQTDLSLEKDISPEVKVFKTRSFEFLKIISRIFGSRRVAYGGFTNVNKKNPLQIFLRFIRGNFFIPDARVGWSGHAYKKARKLITDNGIDTVITTGPPHSAHLTGLKLKKELNIRWIADFRDPWTDIFYYSDMLHTPVARKLDLRKEKKVLKSADRIIAVNNTVGKLLARKIDGKDTGKITVITNGYDEDDFNFTLTQEEEFVITYSGIISGSYKPEIFFRALSDLVKNHPEITFKFRLAGNLSPDIEKEIWNFGLNDIFEYHGYVSHHKLVKLLKSSTALLYVFPVTNNYSGTSGKLFEYLAAGRPIIAIDTPGSDASAIIAECEAGKSFTRNDPEGIRNYLEHLVEAYKKPPGEVKSGNGLYTNYSRRNLTAKLSRLIAEL